MASTAQIVDGKVVAETSPTYEKRSKGDSLDKQAFLQLLVAQMQYQDPLEPMDNTEYISQLAQFSALEAMQNVDQTLTNQNAFNLVGKQVIMSVGSEDGSTTAEIAGKVDFVQIIDGKAYVSIEDKMYSIDDLEYVVSDDYLNKIVDEGSKENGKENGNETDNEAGKEV